MARWFASILSGWQPAGTKPPAGWPDNDPWQGVYSRPTDKLSPPRMRRLGKRSPNPRRCSDGGPPPAAEKEAALTETLSPGTAAKVTQVVMNTAPARVSLADFRLHVMLESWIEFFGKGAFRVGEASMPNQVLQQTGHANKVSSCFYASLRVSRPLSYGVRSGIVADGRSIARGGRNFARRIDGRDDPAVAGLL